ncbi:MAG: CHAD domain-containing protein [Luteolibacter sp.]
MTPPIQSNARFARDQLAAGCENMENLLNGLLDSKGRVAEEVHAIRKLGKTLRGGFALFRLKGAAKEIQAIGRLLSGPRDAVSRLKTWNLYAPDELEKVAAAIAGLLDQQTHSAARRPPPETISWCIGRVNEARKALAELVEENLDETVAVSLKKLGKQVRKRCLHLDHRAEEDFHDARKALKAYLGAVGFLPADTVHIDPRMAEIAELLGDENDIATLSAWLENHGFTVNFAPSLWKLLRDKRRKLQKRVIADAASLFSAESV